MNSNNTTAVEHVPAEEYETELRVSNSRFICSIAPAFSVDEARLFISTIRKRYPEATHHVPAFVIGHGSSVIAHSSDDGEPSGTAGRPALSVLQGSGLGDAVVVVTRYFGGTKLGTGGLVRAYKLAVQEASAGVARARKTDTWTISFKVPYSLYETINRIAADYDLFKIEADFGEIVQMSAEIETASLEAFQALLTNKSAGSIHIEKVKHNPRALVPVRD